MKTVPLRYIVRLNSRVLAESTDPEYGFRYVEIGDVSRSAGVNLEGELINFADAPSRARRLATPGDTVVSTVRTYLRAVAEVPGSDVPLVFSTGFAVLEPMAVESRYLSYAARAEPFIHEIVARSTGVSYPAINASELLDISIPNPTPENQRRIADFLDDRGTRIDRIIAGRREQSARSTGVRRAAIQALFDDVADRQGVIRLGYALTRLEQGWSPQADATPASDDEWGVMRSGCVNGGTFIADDNKRLPEGLTPKGEYEIRPGDLLMSRASGSLDLIGSVAVVPSDVRAQLMLCDKIYRLTPSKAWRAEFLAVMLGSWANRERIRLGVSGAEGMANNIPSGVVRDLRVPHATMQEQNTVIADADAVIARDRQFAEAAQRSIDLLTEYKSSLITAAVTGELDVTTAGSGIPNA